MMYKLIPSAVLILFILFSNSVFSELNKSGKYTVKVVGITDGDTVTVLLGKSSYKVRLAQIDTPERGQPYGSKSKKILSDLIFNKEITLATDGVDRYGRYIGNLYLDDLFINGEMVRLGAAWVYRKYAKDDSLYQLEEEARQNKSGIWGLSEFEQIPPWKWRKK